MKLHLPISLVAVLSSCARVTLVDDITFPNVDSKAAVQCILTPGDSIFVAVKTVQSINSQSPNKTQNITEAHITLENITTSQKTTIPYTGKSGIYGCSQRNFPILSGNTYHMMVSVKNLPSLQATCRMPSRAAVIDTIAYGESYSDGLISKLRRVALTWLDSSGANERYSYFISSQYLHQGDTLRETSFDNTLITQAGNRFYYNDDTIDSGTPHTYYLFTTDQNLYAFFTIAQRMEKNLRSNPSDFFGGYQGITPTFTNIQNGYGIFGGYLKTSKTISLL